jgi:NitT/TauT family transport system substrate-binding protein
LKVLARSEWLRDQRFAAREARLRHRDDMTEPLEKELATQSAGGPSTFLILATTEAFARESPKTTKAVLSAVEDAMMFIKGHRAEAAAIYLKVDAKLDQAFVERLLADPANVYDLAPLRVINYVEFLKKTKAMRNSPTDWHELFLPLIADLQGS